MIKCYTAIRIARALWENHEWECETLKYDIFCRKNLNSALWAKEHGIFALWADSAFYHTLSLEETLLIYNICTLTCHIDIQYSYIFVIIVENYSSEIVTFTWTCHIDIQQPNFLFMIVEKYSSKIVTEETLHTFTLKCHTDIQSPNHLLSNQPSRWRDQELPGTAVNWTMHLIYCCPHNSWV